MSENFRQCLKDAFRYFQDERNGESQEGAVAGQKNAFHSSTPSTGHGQFDSGTQQPIASVSTPVTSSSQKDKSSVVHVKASPGTGSSASEGSRAELGIQQPSSLVEIESIFKAVCRHTKPRTTEFNATNYTADGGVKVQVGGDAGFSLCGG